MSSLLDVAKAMSAEAAGGSANLSLVDVAKAENAANASKPLSLMDVAKQEAQPVEKTKQTLQQLAQEIDKEDRSRIQAALESAAQEVNVERQELRSQILKQAAEELVHEEQQAAQALQTKFALEKSSTRDVAGPERNKEHDEEDGYSSFEDEEDPKKDSKKQEEPIGDDPAEEEESYDPPPRTTPSDSKESKEFLRAVYRADKYQVRDMLDGDVVNANIADQVRTAERASHSLRHSKLTFLLMALVAWLEWVALGCFPRPPRHSAASSPERSRDQRH
ncbi:unnamed protein product [Phytophthora fragariaefolia]|uniref:Unnamed protein product n=1 Tax=Phytophthora fragariaefolia TaxID=1490495 RepID=A0A9W6YNK8_9STRA|nr:unnamed protein product [Phytophthora fragariaefolia]